VGVGGLCTVQSPRSRGAAVAAGEEEESSCHGPMAAPALSPRHECAVVAAGEDEKLPVRWRPRPRCRAPVALRRRQGRSKSRPVRWLPRPCR
jgi:hypothetical protein